MIQDQLPDHLTTLSTCPHIQGAQRLSQPEAWHFSTITTHGINCYWHSGITDQNKRSHITFVLLMNWNHIIMNYRENVKWRNVSCIHVWLLVEQFTEKSLKTCLSLFILPLAAVKTLTKITFEMKLRMRFITNNYIIMQYLKNWQCAILSIPRTWNKFQIQFLTTSKLSKYWKLWKRSQSKSVKVLHQTQLCKRFFVLCLLQDWKKLSNRRCIAVQLKFRNKVALVCSPLATRE